MKYILTKLETIKRTEKIEYLIDISTNIKNKDRYANNQIVKNNYEKCKLVDIIDSEILDDEIVGLTMKKV
ncbi:MAG: hypothetical protein V1661_01875 [bacterium]